ncbi:hypothetical protein K491DRAFT_150445 [Lophiostoma macrostomum CBS 122681]|uniref:Uncharacterized protein n=1 Tax=Lophiostoma macrostomum CBS 122681 TaxID=1314788 RepID=A0A6A6THY5_9PLEO|nr:hypothetical protein K491DRAFT_150445 [Lophiostoma macrostomum CBS 122681]
MPTALPSSIIRDLHHHYTISYAQQIILKSRDPVFLVVSFMPPLSIPTGSSRISRISTSSDGVSLLSSIFLLALVAAVCLRIAIVYSIRKKRRTETLHRHSDSEKSSIACQDFYGKDPRQCQYPEKQNQQRRSDSQFGNCTSPTFKPIYPWIAPPTPLPGPYDPQVYPLPTIRRHSYADPSKGLPLEHETISYTRRVSTNSIPHRQASIQGMVTTSSHGWRRNQWVVSGG